MTVGPAHKHEPATFTPSFQLFQGCLLFKAHYHGCDIHICLSLSLSLCPRRHTALQGIQDKQVLPFPLTSFGILPDFFSNSTFSFLFVFRTTGRLEIGFHWIHRTLGGLLETFVFLLLLLLFLLAKPGLDWIGLDVYDMDMDMDISGFSTDFS